MKWLKEAILISFLLFLMPFALAESSIDISGTDVYNLGEKITASVSLLEDENHYGFLKAILVCQNYDLQYYTAPLNLEANFRTLIPVPELPLFASMKGTCSIRADFEDTESNRISRAVSKTFLVTDKLNISTEKIISSLPDETVVLEGNVRKVSGENLDSGNVKISFNNQDFDTEVEFGNFRHTLQLDADLDIGNYPITINVKDKNENYADEVVQLNVLPVPTSIENRLENEKVKPGSALKAKIILYDHKERAMNGTINVDLLDIDGKKLVSKGVESLDWVNYEFNRQALPGIYTIISKTEGIVEETEFEVEAVSEISMEYSDEVVIVENIGNVEYDDETTIVLESDGKNYLINKKIKLDPGEIMNIDLSKEVPEGTYDVVLPDTEENESKLENIIEDVSISDNRPAYKKVGSGMGAISGAVVGASDYIASRPILASFILIVIIIVIVGYYSKGAIANTFKKKEPEGGTSELFKDFNFEDEGKKDNNDENS